MAVETSRLPSGSGTSEGSQTLLWVGNIDVRLSEFKLLKLLERFGKLAKFDYLLHQRGPDAGKPRGYAFIAYETPEDARRALHGLNGFKFGERHLSVHYANDRNDDGGSSGERRPKPVAGASSAAQVVGVSGGKITKPGSKPALLSDRKMQIAAIEAKLRAMERNSAPPVVNVTQTGAARRYPFGTGPHHQHHLRRGPGGGGLSSSASSHAPERRNHHRFQSR